jgi:uncharacterized protein YciI
MSEMSTFIYVLKLVGERTPEKLSDVDEAVVNEHFEYLRKGLSDGLVRLAGRCLDGEFGIVIFKADSRERAMQFMKSDPAVKNGVMEAELHPFRIALLEERLNV